LLAGAAALSATFAYKKTVMDLAPVAECAVGSGLSDKNLV